MGKAKQNSIYVIQTCIFSLGDRFLTFNPGLNHPWNELFLNQDIEFEDIHLNKNTKAPEYKPEEYDISDEYKIPHSLNYPFIKNVGELVYDSRSPLSSIFRTIIYDDDSRLKLRYFKLKKPLKIKTKINDIFVDGKIFLHVYRYGICAMIFSFSVSCADTKDLKKMHDVIVELRPWRQKAIWKWSSKFGERSLFEIFKEVKSNIVQSISLDISSDYENIWYTAIKYPSHLSPKKISDGLLMLNSNYKTVNIDERFSKTVYLLLSRQGFVAVNRANYKRRSALQFFWKIHAITEYTHIKRFAYSKCNKYLKDQIATLRDERISVSSQILKKKRIINNDYDRKIAQFITFLERPIQYKECRSFHRFLYHNFADVFELKAAHKEFNHLLKGYEDELIEWDPAHVRILKKIFAPFRYLIGFSTE